MLLVLKKEWLRLVPLLVATIVVGIGAYAVGYSAITDMQRSHAEYVASTFATYLLEDVPDLEAMIEGQRSPDAIAATIGGVKSIGTVFEFRLFDRQGALRADSVVTSRDLTVGPDAGGRSDAAAAVLGTGHASFKLREGDAKSMPVFYSDIMIPLVDGNRTIGVLGVLTDETETWPALFEQFRTVLGQVVVLIALAFGLPGIMYLRRTGQLAKAAKRLNQTTQYDELTGCLNRATFTRIVHDLAEGAKDRGLALAVHVIDLDRFKDVNESRGHAVGDELLRLSAQRLRKLMGTRERIARLGADEFAICQPYFVNSPQAVAELANDIVRAMARPFDIGSTQVQVGASVGYSVYPRDGRTVAELMRAADIAIHKAKERNRGKAVAFDPSMQVERQRRQVIEARMRAALVNDGFEVYFQPFYEAGTDRLRGFEALLRLRDEDGAHIPPVEFIPIAEEIGMIADIGLWVLRQSCRMARQWPVDLVVSVNLSPAQFAAGNMAATVRDVLKWSGLPPHLLELEVTESLLITDTDKVLEDLAGIKELGVSIALDDFGTGYSSLSYLWRFPFDKLKVDKSFMTDLAVAGGKSREILSTIVALGRVLGLTITAEGVETDEQAAALRALDCDLLQGFLLGRPMRAIDVAATVLKGVSGKLPVEPDVVQARGAA